MDSKTLFTREIIFHDKIDVDDKKLIKALKGNKSVVSDNDRCKFLQYYPTEPSQVIDDFFNIISTHMNDIMENTYEFEVDNMGYGLSAIWYNWSNSKFNSRYEPLQLHYHPNAWFSGVYYPDQKNDLKIEFRDEQRPLTILPKVKKFNTLNCSKWIYEFEPKTVVLFPSTLRHAAVQDIPGIRKSISFNIFPRGEVDDYFANKLYL